MVKPAVDEGVVVVVLAGAAHADLAAGAVCPKEETKSLLNIIISIYLFGDSRSLDLHSLQDP